MSLVWLSHVLDSGTPLYAGANDIKINLQKSIDKGDSCNTSILSLPSHSGTHVDAPFHFLHDGKRISDFEPEEWVFQYPKVLNMPAIPGQLIRPTDIQEEVSKEDNVDLVLLKTGFERKRQEEIYWKEGPGLSASLAGHLKECFPNLRAVGVDFLSISSLTNREEGRSSHRSFLELGILIFEDLSLCCLNQGERLSMVIALPLRFTGGDGAPCSVVGWVKEQ